MRRSAFIAAAALALGVAAPAVAADELPGADTALVQVFVDGDTDVAALSERYDVAEYKQVEDDGSILLAVDTTAAERAELRAAGFRIGRTIEDAATRAAVAEERDAQREAGRARRGLRRERRAQAHGAAVAPPGETVIQRAHRFTNYAGTFLYVEAHNKATRHPGRHDASSARRRRCRTRAPTASTARRPTWRA